MYSREAETAPSRSYEQHVRFLRPVFFNSLGKLSPSGLCMVPGDFVKTCRPQVHISFCYAIDSQPKQAWLARVRSHPRAIIERHPKRKAG